MNKLLDKVIDRKAMVAVMGLGYAGLPLALTFARVFKVVGYDPNIATVSSLLDGKSHVDVVTDRQLTDGLGCNFLPTSQESHVSHCDFIIICVPTLLTLDGQPDLTHIRDCSEIIARFLRKNQFIVLESTSYPGTTDDVVIPILEKTGLKAGTDFGVAYSPQRFDSGKKNYTLPCIPKVVGGINPECTNIAAALYESVIPAVVTARDCRTAEACKILENVFRSVNIALINEIALVFERMGIDVWEVINAASTKPFGFMPFYPGPGVGGACVPISPRYLSYQARRYGIAPQLVELSTELNDKMQMHIVHLVQTGLQRTGKNIRGCRIAIIGLSYKADIGDTRGTPAKNIIEQLVNLGGEIVVYDPYVQVIETATGSFRSGDSLGSTLKGADCAVFLVEHDMVRKLRVANLKALMAAPIIIIDCKNIFNIEHVRGVVYLAVGKPLGLEDQDQSYASVPTPKEIFCNCR